MLLNEYQEQWEHYRSAVKACAKNLVGTSMSEQQFEAIHFRFSNMWWQYNGEKYNFPFIFPYVSAARPDRLELRVNTLASSLKRKINAS